MPLPSFIIIGAMKCGTTSLYRYFQAHPQINMCSLKEPEFFSSQWHLGVSWYADLFGENTVVCGEASTGYTKYSLFPETAQRMHSVIPRAKLIYILRDPLQRICSHYAHNVNAGQEKKTLGQCLKDKTSHYVNVSRYFMQLERYLAFYPRDSIKVILFEDLVAKRDEILKELFHFLEVREDFQSVEFLKKHNTFDDLSFKPFHYIQKAEKHPLFKSFVKHMPLILRGKKQKPPEMTLELKLRTAVHLKEDIEKLKLWTGRTFSEWETVSLL